MSYVCSMGRIQPPLIQQQQQPSLIPLRLCLGVWKGGEGRALGVWKYIEKWKNLSHFSKE